MGRKSAAQKAKEAKELKKLTKAKEALVVEEISEGITEVLIEEVPEEAEIVEEVVEVNKSEVRFIVLQGVIFERKRFKIGDNLIVKKDHERMDSLKILCEKKILTKV